MRTAFLVGAVLVLTTAPVSAQAPTVPPPTVPPVASSIDAPVVAPLGSSSVMDTRPHATACGSQIWGSADYLLWWVKGAPLPIPLVTTGDPSVGFPLVNTAGAIGQPGTRVLLGDGNINFGAFSGSRLTVGGWVDNQQTIGVEASGFLLVQRSSRFAASSDAVGNPPLYFPAFDVQTGTERAVPISDVLRQFSGNVSVTSNLQLWGAELNGVLNLWRRPGLEVSLLGGFRFADLNESLQIHNTTNDLLLINTETLNDQFGTRNQFYGGQLGSRVSWQFEQWSVDLTVKVALGGTHQSVNIQGDITQTGPGAFSPGTFPGGLYTQPTNISQRSANEFTVLPSAELKIAYQLTPALRAFAGYDFLYWNQVVRPGNQIDRNINQSQSPIFGFGTLVGQAAPLPLFNRSDFWAQGVNFGLEFRY